MIADRIVWVWRDRDENLREVYVLAWFEGRAVVVLWVGGRLYGSPFTVPHSELLIAS